MRERLHACGDSDCCAFFRRVYKYAALTQVEDLSSRNAQPHHECKIIPSVSAFQIKHLGVKL